MVTNIHFHVDDPHPALNIRDRKDVGKRPTKEEYDEINKSKQLLLTIGDVSVFFIDGNIVMMYADMDYDEGGNDMAYPMYVPIDEVWIDDSYIGKQNQSCAVPEYIAIACHELVERKKMQMDPRLLYDNAHEQTNAIEKRLREGKEKFIDLMKEYYHEEPKMSQTTGEGEIKAANGLVDDIGDYVKGFEQYLDKPTLVGNEKTYTVGYGTKYINGKPITDPNLRYTKDDATRWMNETLTENNTLIDKNVKVPLNYRQRLALNDFLYNVGSTQFLGSHLLKYINEQRPKEMITDEWNKWKFVEGNIVMPHLQQRRSNNLSLYYGGVDVYREPTQPIVQDNNRFNRPVKLNCGGKLKKGGKIKLGGGLGGPDKVPSDNTRVNVNIPSNTNLQTNDSYFLNNFNTPLTPEEEKQFQTWKQQNAPNDLGSDYDLRGFWKSGQSKSGNGHMTDQFKKPNHPTFSTESIYNKGIYQGGTWTNNTFMVGPTNLKYHSRESLSNYFKLREPDYRVIYPKLLCGGKLGNGCNVKLKTKK